MGSLEATSGTLFAPLLPRYAIGHRAAPSVRKTTQGGSSTAACGAALMAKQGQHRGAPAMVKTPKVGQEGFLCSLTVSTQD